MHLIAETIASLDSDSHYRGETISGKASVNVSIPVPCGIGLQKHVSDARNYTVVIS